MADFREVLDRNGLRCTRQREVIFSALAASKTHPTADELFQRVKSVEPGLSLATVYNTLDALSACGLVRRLPCPSGTGPCRFDADIHDHVHISTAEGEILDAPEDLSTRLIGSIPPDMVAELEARMGVRVRGLSIQVVAGAVELATEQAAARQAAAEDGETRRA